MNDPFFVVVYRYGSCIDQDHSCGVETVYTEEGVRDLVAHYLKCDSEANIDVFEVIRRRPDLEKP